MKKQVDSDHYYFDKYCYPERWASYYNQINEIISLSPESILEVGGGDRFLKNFLEKNSSISYKSLDIAEDLQPDIVGSVDKIPLADDSMDAACAFEVLEHLPFDNFEKSISELKRISRKYVLISLPHFGPPIKLNFKLPFFPEFRFLFKLPIPFKHEFNGQHYWEIGKRGYPGKKIRSILASHFRILKDFIPYESPYHHFYILEKNRSI